jgi:hypothetical protein
VPFSAKTLADVTKAALGVIERQSETAKRIVYAQSGLVTRKVLFGSPRILMVRSGTLVLKTRKRSSGRITRN